MRVHSETEVLAEVRRNPFTVVFFNRQGQVVELLKLKERPTPDLVLKIKDRHKPGAFRFVQAGEYGSADYRKWVDDALEGMELAEQGKLRPGANPVF